MRFSHAFFLALALLSGPALLPAQSTLGIISDPKSVREPAPVYPFELLLEGRSGSAEVLFTIEYAGKAILASVVNASDPAFAKALLADIEANEFLPPRVNGQPKLAQATLRHSFNPASELDAESSKLLAELRKPLPAILRADQLDKKPAPVRQYQPVYPYSLQSDGISGKAEIEIVVDSTGRVLFPRIVSATNEDIGYAAAAAIGRWRYNPPLKNGQPVAAFVRVTITYDAAKLSTSW